MGIKLLTKLTMQRNRSQKHKLETERRYGWFRCSNCNKNWGSSWCTCKKGTNVILYKQECKRCKTAMFPYWHEKLKCRNCRQLKCICRKKDKNKERNINDKKPHIKALCSACKDLNCEYQKRQQIEERQERQENPYFNRRYRY